jgi:elongation factor G
LSPEEQIFPDSSAVALSTAAREAVQAALVAAKHQATFAMMEPVMFVTISVSESDLGAVVHDLSSARGGQIVSLDDESPYSASSHDDTLVVDSKLIYAPPDPYGSEASARSSQTSTRLRQITARVPLREMVGYLRYLRALTGGRGTFVMAVDRFEKVSGTRLQSILKEISGI